MTMSLMSAVILSSFAISAIAAPVSPTATPPATSNAGDRVYSPIKLPKQGFIHLDVLDSHKERRTFLVTCEKTLDSKITDSLRQTGAGYHPLKKGEKQSLINHWQTPATDYVIVCEGN